MGQYRTLRQTDPQRILATMHVLTCITVFAVCKKDGTCFGAHIYLRTVLGILWRSQKAALRSGRIPNLKKVDVLPTVTSALTKAFSHVSPSEVSVALVGGHKAMDTGIGSYFHGDKERDKLSWQVRNTVEKALPGAAIDSSLLCRFDGADIMSMRDEARLCYYGQRYHVLGIDRWTDKVISQTKYCEGAGCVPEGVMIMEEESRVLAAMSQSMIDLDAPSPMVESRL